MDTLGLLKMLNKLFYTFEGPEGAGKSTVIRLVKEMLCNEGSEVIISREPGGVEVGEKIREIIVNNKMTTMTEILLFLASRTEHYDKVIRPALDNDVIVLLDRFILSSTSIQGAARGHSISDIMALHEIALPDLDNYTTFYLDIPVEVGLSRKSGDEINKFERESVDFHKKAQAYARKMAVRNENIILVDATGTPKETATIIFDYIKGVLQNG